MLDSNCQIYQLQTIQVITKWNLFLFYWQPTSSKSFDFDHIESTWIRPEVMAGTSVSTLSKVGSTSSVLETSFNYVWENLSEFYDICGETVKWCPSFCFWHTFKRNDRNSGTRGYWSWKSRMNSQKEYQWLTGLHTRKLRDRIRTRTHLASCVGCQLTYGILHIEKVDNPHSLGECGVAV